MRPASAFGLRERGRDAAVSPYFAEVAGIRVLMASGSFAHTLGALHLSRGAPPRRNQKRPRVLPSHGALQRIRSAGEASALFPVSPLEQDIQKKVATENANREKDGS